MTTSTTAILSKILFNKDGNRPRQERFHVHLLYCFLGGPSHKLKEGHKPRWTSLVIASANRATRKPVDKVFSLQGLCDPVLGLQKPDYRASINNIYIHAGFAILNETGDPFPC